MNSFKKFLLLMTEQFVRVSIYLFVRTFKFIPAFKNVSIATVIDLLRTSRGLLLPEEIDQRLSESTKFHLRRNRADTAKDFGEQLHASLTILNYYSDEEFATASHFGSQIAKLGLEYALVRGFKCAHYPDLDLKNTPDPNWLYNILGKQNWSSVVIAEASCLQDFSLNDILRLHIQNLADEKSLINSFRVVASPIGHVQWGFDIFRAEEAKYIDVRLWGLSRRAFEIFNRDAALLSGSVTEIASNLSMKLAGRGISVKQIPIEISETLSNALRLNVGCETCWEVLASAQSDLRTLRFRALPIDKLIPVNTSLPLNSGKKRILLVQPISGGGLPATTSKLFGQLEDNFDIFTLVCDRGRVRLSIGADQVHELFEVELPNPVEPFSHRSSDYDYLFSVILGHLDIDIIQIEHMAWQSIGIKEISSYFNIPYFFTFHDYYSVCASHNLLDENLVFCGGVCTSGTGYCQTALWPKYELRFLKNGLVHRWQEQMGQFLSGASGIFVPSKSAGSDLRTIFPHLQSKIRVAPHTTSVQFDVRASKDQVIHEKLRILVLGDIGPHKGEYKVRKFAEYANSHNFEIHLLGPLRKLLSENVKNYGPYSVSDLPSLVNKIQPQVAFLPSITHETFSHALTELLSLGIPVVAFSGSGAVEERITQAGVGVIIDPKNSPEHWIMQINEEVLSKTAFETLSRNITKWQTKNRNFSAKEMSLKYLDEYESALGS
ncbi:glycosyltransferase involved in cell wall biosynthesis [Aurantimicrobium minutum]|uniref:glycosyltransferase n=1 Tax=Aurantimicrobium minutum TaxID=708131 RepID=UPI002473EAF4|nr:glycosyltransferase [Aurantimicrobium minutum]MDH6278213.1 glycosyltransferase involved in cell wall biosynthesis [Aurantimicrobium minutum]